MCSGSAAPGLAREARHGPEPPRRPSDKADATSARSIRKRASEVASTSIRCRFARGRVATELYHTRSTTGTSRSGPFRDARRGVPAGPRDTQPASADRVPRVPCCRVWSRHVWDTIGFYRSPLAQQFLADDQDLGVLDAAERASSAIHPATRMNIRYSRHSASFRVSVQDAAAFAPGRGGQPAGKRSRAVQAAQMIHQLQPDVLGVGGLQPVSLSRACKRLQSARVRRDRRKHDR